MLRRAVELGVNLIDTAGLLRPRGLGASDLRGSAPVPWGPRHRDQGRLHASERPVGPRRTPRAPARGLRGKLEKARGG